MPDQAFSKISTLAGPEIPARHQTLNHFLQSTLNAKLDRSQMVAAVEAEPRILLHLLATQVSNQVSTQGLSQLSQWHQNLSDQTFSTQALTLANNAKLFGSGRVWQRAYLASSLARELSIAANYSDADVYRCRLLALLLGVGHERLMGEEAFSLPRIDQLAREEADFGQTGSEVGFEILQGLGFPASDCDVLRYQYEDLDILKEAGDDLVLVSVAGRLADAMLTDFELANQYFQLIEDRLGLDSMALREILEQAYKSFRIVNNALLSNDDFSSTLAKANLAGQIRSCGELEPLETIGREVLGIHQLTFARKFDQVLVIELGNDHFSVDIDAGTSLISQAFQTQSVFSAEENALVAIVDKQVLSRLATGVLWVLPLGSVGVAICGIDQSSSPGNGSAVVRQDEFIISVFVSACQRILEGEAAANNAKSGATIEVDQVRRQVQELTHEVNNPLAIVQNYLKMLSLKLGDDSPVQTDIQTISSEMLRIGSIIQKYADIGSESSLELLPVDVNELLQRLTGVFRGSQANVTFSFELDSAMPTILSRADQLKQVVLNLLKNAAEVLEEQVDAQICIATSSQVNLGGHHYVEILIQDNGPGIPAEIYQNLFSANNSGKGAGHSGIGLSVANRLISDLGGLMSCKTSSVGTVFQVLLPIEQKHSVKRRGEA
ncbi:MAG: nitrogen-specific signal transduction histidine kinase [Candidatus Azotimanducaceae bacterium]|jgi:nitrogen-specific signal transduction histidine kinase